MISSSVTKRVVLILSLYTYNRKNPMKSSPLESEGHNEDVDDLFQVSVRSFSTRGEFSRWHRLRCRWATQHPTSIMARLVVLLSSCFCVDAAGATIPNLLFRPLWGRESIPRYTTLKCPTSVPLFRDTFRVNSRHCRATTGSFDT